MNTPSARSSRSSIGGPSAYSDGEHGALLVRHEQLDDLEAVLEALRRSGCAARRGPRPCCAETWSSAGKAVAEPVSRERVDGVDLVQHDLDGQLVRADLGEHAVDRADHLVERRLGRGRVDDVEHEVGDRASPRASRRSPRRARAGSRRMKPTVSVTRYAPALVLERARRRVERLEQPVVDGDAGAGERIEERRLADVRVAGERDRRRRRADARLPPRVALLRELLQPALEQLRFAGGRGGGRSRAGSPPVRASRRRRRGARGAATCLACAGGCTRAARARPGACPRP